MNRILKIVGGPLKGAEIALVGGTRVKVGSGDSCDILVSDATLPKLAFELDVGDEDVTLVTPDGETKTMLDFEAREFGSSAFAIGPAEGVWQEIVWPERGNQESGTGDQELGNEDQGSGSGEEPAEEKPEAEGAKPETGGEEPGAENEKPASRVGYLVSLVVFILVVALLGWFFWRYRDRVAETWRSWFSGRGAEVATAEAAGPTIGDIAARYGLKLSGTADRTVLTGNFKTRAQRLKAVAEIYSVLPGADLELTDDESLLTASSDLLRLVTDGAITVTNAADRALWLKGYAPSPEALHDILVALNTDVPGIDRVDCRGVVCGTGTSEPEYSAPILPGVTPKPRKAKSVVRPNLPVCGILTTPYPCLILRNGARVSVGGEFGGCVIERITSDSVTLRNTSGSFEWRP